MTAPIRFKHVAMPLIALPSDANFSLAFDVADGYDPGDVDSWRVSVARRSRGGTPSWTNDAVDVTAQIVSFDFATDIVSDDDEDVTLADIIELKDCRWSISALDDDGVTLWVIQGDVTFVDNTDGISTTAALGSALSILLDEETTISVTILGNTAATSLDAAALAAIIHAGTEKVTLAANDEFTIADSAASYGLKKSKWSTISAAISTLISSAITALNLGSASQQPSSAFAAALGANDNYVTDAEKAVIGNTSGTNTGDQDLSGLVVSLRQTLTDDASITYNVASGVNAQVTLGGDRALLDPVRGAGDPTSGEAGHLLIIQDATGGRALTIPPSMTMVEGDFGDIAAMLPGTKADLFWTATGSGDTRGWLYGAGFDPTAIPGLKLWLDASDASTLYDATSGGSLVAADGTVARWEDKSGNANHGTQGTSGKRPLRKTSIQGGRDVLRFDDSDDGMVTGLNLDPNSAEMTIFVVYSYRGASPSSARAINGTQNIVIGPFNGKYESFAAGGAFVPNAPSVIQNRFISHSLTLQRADSARGRSIGSISGQDHGAYGGENRATGVVHIAAGDTGISYAEPLNGDIAEVLVWNHALDDQDRKRVFRYLKEKWSLVDLI